MAICLAPVTEVQTDSRYGNMTAVSGADNQASAAVPFYFGPTARRLFGWYYPAAKGHLAADQAIVMCKPLGYEGQCVHAYYRFAAERMSAEGIAVLRFDYDGTGDSYGSDDDPDRIDSWISSIGFAIDELRVRSGMSDIALFGVRFGATLALIAASRRGDIQSLILWATCRAGRSYLREMRLLKAAHRGGNTPAADSGLDSPDYEEAAGFYYTTETVAALQGLDAATIEKRPAYRALMIGRDDLPNDARLLNRLRALGTETQSVAWSGYEQMMLDPHQSEVPVPTVDSILDWMRSSNEAPVTTSASQGARDSDFSARLEAPDYSETTFASGVDPAAFGILTLPTDRRNVSLPILLLMTVGSNLHTGPNRMYVTLARRMATLGFRVLRLDVPGIGDSARGSQSSRIHIYSDRTFQSVRMIMEDLSGSRGADKFVLIGLCSGAYVAYNVAKVDPRVVAQILINPQTYEWKEGDSLDVVFARNSIRLSRYYTTAMRDPATLKRILYREVNLRHIASVLSERLSERLRVAARSLASMDWRHGSFETEVCRHFRNISSRGTETLFLFADGDFGIEATEIHVGPKAKKMRSYNTVSYEVIVGADHTFSPRSSREVMIERIEAFARSKFLIASDDGGKQTS